MEAEEQRDVVVVGGGQAGLAMSWYLSRRGTDHVVLDAGEAVGHVWRSRWDSLKLFSPAQYDSLPGQPFPAPADTYPGKDDVADYLAAYAVRHDLPVRLGSEVTRVGQSAQDPGGFVVEAGGRPLRARQVVLATGPFQRPRIPAVAATVGDGVVQLHSAAYTRPDALPPGPCLVVGAGNSGLQIAEDLASTRETHLAAGSDLHQLPQRILGRDLFFWLTRTGLVNAPATSRIGARIKSRGELVIGTSQSRVAALGVQVHPRVVGADGDRVSFADGTSLLPTSIVWATGFTRDHDFLEVPGAVVAGQVTHRRGVTDVPGLYVLGLPWQHSRGSSLLGFVHHDAAWVEEQMSAELSRR